MRESEKLLEEARKCFAQAARCDDLTSMISLADRGRHLLEQAEAAASREKGGNGRPV